MATIGQVIPEGTFQAFHEQEIRPITLESYRGRWVVLVFYPGDFTFICPTELEELGALYADFRKVGAEVIGVSTDSVYVHKAWHDTSPSIKKLAFPLLADSGRTVVPETGRVSLPRRRRLARQLYLRSRRKALRLRSPLQ